MYQVTQVIRMSKSTNAYNAHGGNALENAEYTTHIRLYPQTHMPVFKFDCSFLISLPNSLCLLTAATDASMCVRELNILHFTFQPQL